MPNCHPVDIVLHAPSLLQITPYRQHESFLLELEVCKPIANMCEIVAYLRANVHPGCEIQH